MTDGASHRTSERRGKRTRQRNRQETLPVWLTVEKLAFHRKVMHEREVKHQEATARQKAHLDAVYAANKERLRVAAEQARQCGLLRAAIGRLEDHPLDDGLAQVVLDQTLPIDQPLREDMVQALYRSFLSRAPTQLEMEVFFRDVFTTQVPLPYLADHPMALDEKLYPRLDLQGQLCAILVAAVEEHASALRRMQEFLHLHGEAAMVLLLRAADRAGVLEYLPWQIQYRVAITWLVAGDARVRTVPWKSEVVTALAVAQATDRVSARAALDGLFDMVASRAYLNTDPLDFTPLVPPCRNKAVSCTHCEGSRWMSDAAYCPTLRGPCTLDLRGASPTIMRIDGPAWIRPNLTLPPAQWSVLELLHHAGLKPKELYPELRNDEELVSRLGGWLNRLNKIRSRLRCQTCSTIMHPRKKYAKFMAKFPVTVFACEHHPIPVKLTDCWLCDDIIDSRDSPISDGQSTYNICCRCGAGEEGKATIGRRCPTCGQGPMRLKTRATVNGRRQMLECSRSGCSCLIDVFPKQKRYLAPELVQA
ncbi:hypothetical protein [Deinococcus sonorensis]|uniref:Uncharacterized protein n=2 Tax=Deinococcus sonorensis TaxID=309891 RepID=A0AAU7UFY1_9DEIO